VRNNNNNIIVLTRLLRCQIAFLCAMTDVTSLVNDVLKGREAPRVGHCSYSLEQINGFLQDAYTIV